MLKNGQTYFKNLESRHENEKIIQDVNNRQVMFSGTFSVFLGNVLKNKKDNFTENERGIYIDSLLPFGIIEFNLMKP